MNYFYRLENETLVIEEHDLSLSLYVRTKRFQNNYITQQLGEIEIVITKNQLEFYTQSIASLENQINY